jgi:serpin B
MIRILCIAMGAAAPLIGAVPARGDAPPKPTLASARQEVGRVDPAVTAGLAQGCNEFAIDLYRHCVERRIKESDNLLLAPYSLAEALSLISTGARGKTAEEIARALHLGITPEQAGPAFASLGIGAGGYLADGAAESRSRFGARVRDAGGDGGVVVTEVKDGSPAWDAGLRPKDRIVRLSEWPIHDATDYVNALDNFVASVEGEVQSEAGRRSFTARLNVPSAREPRRVRPVIATALWARAGLEFQPAFRETAALFYNATPEVVDFAADLGPARARLNRRMAENSDDRIRELLPPDAFDAKTGLLLASAISLETTWKNRFDPDRTTDADFTSPGGERSVRMMQKRSAFLYGRTKTFEVLDLHLDGGYAMALFLPNDPAGLRAFEGRLIDAKNHDHLLGQLRPHTINVAIPRFQITAAVDLAKVLRDLGMPTVFGREADLSGMIRGPSGGVGLSRLVYRASLDVQEAGVGIPQRREGAPEPIIPPAATFKANRPFLFTIRDTKTKVILFIGRVVSPGPD